MSLAHSTVPDMGQRGPTRLSQRLKLIMGQQDQPRNSSNSSSSSSSSGSGSIRVRGNRRCRLFDCIHQRFFHCHSSFHLTSGPSRVSHDPRVRVLNEFRVEFDTLELAHFVCFTDDDVVGNCENHPFNFCSLENEDLFPRTKFPMFRERHMYYISDRSFLQSYLLMNQQSNASHNSN